MITDFDVGRLIAAQYAGDRSKFYTFVDPAHDDFAGIAWAAAKVEGVWVICFEGSHDPPDWAHDFDPARISVQGLGTLRAGFFANMVDTYQAIFRACKGPKIFCGHSLGAARADIATGLACASLDPPLAYIRWGEPAPCHGPELGTLLKDVQGRSYFNTDPSGYMTEQDLVCDVPPALFGWRHPQQLIRVNGGVDPERSVWDLLAYHHFPRYLAVTPATVIL